ncbi:MAG: alpha/beta hydrolase [Pseudonocardia sp.]
MSRTEHPFRSGGVECAAWLYRPSRPGTAPGVVMAHGFGMTRACRLDALAERFAGAGMAVLLFDYRGFGDSAGEPRQVVDITGQRADWRAAVAHIRTTPGIDPARIALWGSSFSGGHVLAVAAADTRLAAVVAQVPFVDGPALLRGLGARRGKRRTPVSAAARHGLMLLRNAVRDEVRRRRGRPPVLVPVAGEIGSGAIIAGAGVEAAIRHLVPDDVAWRNEVAASIALRIPFDRPGRCAAAITCPLLIAVCEQDMVAPPAAAAVVAAAAPRGELRRYPFTHVGACIGAGFEALSTDQVSFLTRHLRP